MKKVYFALMTLKRAVISKAFFGAVVGFAAVELLSVYHEICASQGNSCSVLYLYEIVTYAQFWILFLLFGAVPGATLFCSDWENRFVRFSMMRSSKRVYGVSTAFACFSSTFLLIAAGESLFLIVLWLRYPAVLPQDAVNLFQGTGFMGWINSSDIWMYFLIRIMIKAFCSGFFSVFSLWLSTMIPNVFVVLCSPIILYYLLENLFGALKAPHFLFVSVIVKGNALSGSNPWMTLLYPALLFTGLAVIFALLFTLGAKRRMENG